MKNLSYQQVIHIKLWITFLHKTIDNTIFMCYNIDKLRDNTYIKGGYIL